MQTLRHFQVQDNLIFKPSVRRESNRQESPPAASADQEVDPGEKQDHSVDPAKVADYHSGPQDPANVEELEKSDQEVAPQPEDKSEVRLNCLNLRSGSQFYVFLMKV